HYSDSWADPGQQFKPKAWIGKSVAELKTAIAAHTIDILQALKAEDISPRWVQVGNEIRPGMLWDENVALSGAFYDIRECDVKGLNSTNERVKYPQNTQNLAEFVNTGYDAVKKIFPQSIVIVHIDNAWDDLTWWFKQFKEAGGKLDMIGLSHYPQTHSTKLWQEMNLLALKHISQLAKTFQVKVMITEIGVKQNDSASAQVLADFINKARDMESCAGVWYWEPECYEWNGYDMGAFDKNGKPTAIMNAFQSSTKRK
ncbi:glycosyl hydrolase 53 family protein, partial [Phocaeicola dorei]